MKIEKAIKRYFKNGYRMARGVKTKKEMKLGDFTAKIINIITLGKGRKIATFIAKLFGYNDCGCDRRQEEMNKYIFTKNGVRKKND